MKLFNAFRRNEGSRKAAGLIAALATLAGLSMGAGSVAAQEVQLRFITSYPFTGPNATVMYGARKFIEEFNKRAKGKANIRFIGGPEVVATFDQLKALQTGQFDMMSTSNQLFRDLQPMHFFNYLPAAEQVAKMKKGGREILQTVTREAAGVTLVMITSPGIPFYLWSKNPIATVADAKGVKVRGFPGVNEQLAGLLGMVTVSVPAPDVFASLRSGILEGAVRDVISVSLLNEGEFMRHHSEVQICSCSAEVYVANPVWDKLPKDVKSIMLDVAVKQEADSLAYLSGRSAEIVKELEKKYGTKTVKGTPELNDIIGRKVGGANMLAAIKDSKHRDDIIRTFDLVPYLKN